LGFGRIVFICEILSDNRKKEAKTKGTIHRLLKDGIISSNISDSRNPNKVMKIIGITMFVFWVNLSKALTNLGDFAKMQPSK
jgi:hypothetical protein